MASLLAAGNYGVSTKPGDADDPCCKLADVLHTHTKCCLMRSVMGVDRLCFEIQTGSWVQDLRRALGKSCTQLGRMFRAINGYIGQDKQPRKRQRKKMRFTPPSNPGSGVRTLNDDFETRAGAGASRAQTVSDSVAPTTGNTGNETSQEETAAEIAAAGLSGLGFSFKEIFPFDEYNHRNEGELEAFIEIFSSPRTSPIPPQASGS